MKKAHIPFKRERIGYVILPVVLKDSQSGRGARVWQLPYGESRFLRFFLVDRAIWAPEANHIN